MPARYFDDNAAISPEELHVLQSVFDDLRSSRGLDAKSAEADEAAASIVSLFKAGFHTPEELLHMLGVVPNGQADPDT